jgi:hypothetical protein
MQGAGGVMLAVLASWLCSSNAPTGACAKLDRLHQLVCLGRQCMRFTQALWRGDGYNGQGHARDTAHLHHQ